MTRIELLYFDGCPSHESLRARVEELLAASDDRVTLEQVRIDSIEQAEARRFLGSPTLRIDGVDIEPGAGERTDYGLKCRLYKHATGLAGAPSDASLRAAIHSMVRPED